MGLRKEARGIADAEVRIFDERGGSFGTGQTGSNGDSEFPLPPGKAFHVEIKVGDKFCDPIRLFNHGDKVEPSRVLLSFGLKPCCRNVFAKESEEGSPSEAPIEIEPPLSTAMFVIGEISLLTLAAGVCFLAYRRK